MTDEPTTLDEPATPDGPTPRGQPTPTPPEPSTPATTAEPPPPDGLADPPPIGTPVRDITRDRVGIVMDHQAPHIQLCPLDGGREWDADPDHVEPVGPIEVLRARVAEANHRSRRGPLG